MKTGSSSHGGKLPEAQDQSIITASVGNQLYAFPILSIDDTIRVKSITPAPGAPGEIPGVINLRGRIVTTICMRRVLKVSGDEESGGYGVTATHENELYCFLFDKIGEVIPRERYKTEPTPNTIDPGSRRVCTSIARIGSEIAIVLDPDRLVQECFHTELESC